MFAWDVGTSLTVGGSGWYCFRIEFRLLVGRIFGDMAEIKTPIELSYCHDVAYVSSAKEAARLLGTSESSIRRECHRLGVRRIAGKAIAGYVVWAKAIDGQTDLALSFATLRIRAVYPSHVLRRRK